MKILQMVFNWLSLHMHIVEMAMFNTQRAKTPKRGKPELGFMCPACHLMVLYICVKFVKISGVMEWTRVHGRNGYVQFSKVNNSKSRQTRFMNHVFCTPSDGCFTLVWSYQSYGADTKLFYSLMDGRTDTQNFGWYNIIPRHFLWWDKLKE